MPPKSQSIDETPRWVRFTQVLCGGIAVGIFIGLAIAYRIGGGISNLNPANMQIIVATVTLITIVPAALLEVIVRLVRVRKQANEGSQVGQDTHVGQ